MKKKTIIVSVLLGILLIGVVSAGLVGYLSNIISGTINVQGPIFYAIGNEAPQDSDHYVLNINNLGGFMNVDYINIVGTEKIIFRTETFGESISFYKPKLKMEIEAKLIEGSIPKTLDLEFGYLEEASDASFNKICSVNITVNDKDAYKIYSDICNGNYEIDELKEFYYQIEGKSTGDVIIKTELNGGNTKVSILDAI